MGTITKIMSFPVVELYQFLTSLVFILVLFIDLFSFYIPDYTVCHVLSAKVLS